MATFNSTTYVAEAAAGGKPIGGGQGLAGVVRAKRFEVALTSALALNDTINFGYMPKGSRVIDRFLEATDMDSGGPTLTFDVGDAGDTDRLFAAATVGQAAANSPQRGPGSIINPAGNGYKYTSNTLITGLCKAAATTPAAGTLVLTILYVQEDFTTS